MICWSKPVQTRGGKPVEIITTKGRGLYPVVGYVGEVTDPGEIWHPKDWTVDGAFYYWGKESHNDLFNVPLDAG